MEQVGPETKVRDIWKQWSFDYDAPQLIPCGRIYVEGGVIRLFACPDGRLRAAFDDEVVARRLRLPPPESFGFAAIEVEKP